MKMLPLLLIGAALFWIASELAELWAGGRTNGSLWLTAAFHQLMVFGIWGAYLGQGDRRGPLALAATLLVSIGYLVLVYPPLAVALDPARTLDAFMDANPGFKVAGLAAVFGKVLFGASILRARLDPGWTGWVLLVAPLVFAGVMLGGGMAAFALTFGDLLYAHEIAITAVCGIAALIGGFKVGRLSLLSRDLRGSEFSEAVWGSYGALNKVRRDIARAVTSSRTEART